MEVLHLFIIMLAMFGQAFFAGIETGVISIHRMRLRHLVRRGSPGARILQNFLDDSDRLLGTTLAGTNISVVVVSVVGTDLAVRLIGTSGHAVATAAVTLLVLVFGEYLPKAWFRSRPLERCKRYAGVLRFAEMGLRPLSRSVVWLTHWLVPGKDKGALGKPVPFVTREDLKLLAHEGEKDGVLSRRERVMIHRVFELSGKRAGEIKVPRQKMAIVQSGMTLPEFFDVARRTGYTRFPVYDKGQDAFVGVINVFFVLSRQNTDRGETVDEFMRPPLFVPNNMPVDDIFPKMRRSRQPLCLVKNGDDSVVGLITTEDILQTIVGKL